PKARYAVETLLAGLGLAPGWTACDGLAGGGLYNGSSPEAAPAAAPRFPPAPATAAYFAGRAPSDPARMSTLDWGGTAWPLPFDGGDGRSVIEKDVVASTFFWLAGWTEWTTTARDVHGRFPFEGSLHDRLGLAAVPAVDAYRRWLGDRLRERGVPVPGRTWEGAPGWTAGAGTCPRPAGASAGRLRARRRPVGRPPPAPRPRSREGRRGDVLRQGRRRRPRGRAVSPGGTPPAPRSRRGPGRGWRGRPSPELRCLRPPRPPRCRARPAGGRARRGAARRADALPPLDRAHHAAPPRPRRVRARQHPRLFAP